MSKKRTKACYVLKRHAFTSRSVGTRTFHVMRFKPPYKCDLESLTNPTLERQTPAVVNTERASRPEYGEGSEHGRVWKEEARRKKKGYEMRKVDPDSQPWILREQKKGGQPLYVGRKEGGVNTSSSYYILSQRQDGAFEAYPVENWYDFIPPVKYNFLNEEEAEARFEKRHKTLNMFSVMVSKKLKSKQEGGEEEELPGETGEGKDKSKGRTKKDKLALTDSGSDFGSDGDDNSDEQKDSDGGSKKASAKKLIQGKKKGGGDSEAEAGEESDEGDFESKEVDYMSDSSSGSEKEFQVKEALKEAPKDDEEAERHETGEIDKGFTSEEEEDELTEEGKKLKALLGKQDEEGEEISEEEWDQLDSDAPPLRAKSSTPVPMAAEPSDTIMAEDDEETTAGIAKKESGKPQKRAADEDLSAPPVVKKPKVESTTCITEEEVRKYLERKPITSKELMKKFSSKKPDMEKKMIVSILGEIIKHMKDVNQFKIEGKLYLSLKMADQATVA